MNHYVYKIIDPITNEYYIGVRSTKDNIESDSYMGSYLSWKPKNEDKLIKEVIETFSNRKKAQEHEIELIKLYIDDDLNRNYHIPGKGFHMQGNSHTNETKQKIAKMKKGKRHSLKTRKQMSESHKGIIKDDTWRENLSQSLSGKKKSESHKKKMSESHKIPVLQYSMDGEFIKEWPGQIDALRELGINHISSVCKGKHKSAGGFIWKYKIL